MHGARERSSQEGRGGGYGWEVGEVGRVGGGWHRTGPDRQAHPREKPQATPTVPNRTVTPMATTTTRRRTTAANNNNNHNNHDDDDDDKSNSNSNSNSNSSSSSSNSSNNSKNINNNDKDDSSVDSNSEKATTE